MRIDIVTGLPEIVASVLGASILGRAIENGTVSVNVHNLRTYAHDKHKTIDDTPYGGGAGMVLKPEPIFECIEGLLAERKYDEVIFLTPDGEVFQQRTAVELSLKENIILLCGHYKGVDERVRENLVTREISIGDYVLTGGELPALVLVDTISRLVPGVVNDAESLLADSFQEGLLGAPEYTRPAEFRGLKVPDVLLNGNHREIAQWRQNMQMERTKRRRPDLLS